MTAAPHATRSAPRSAARPAACVVLTTTGSQEEAGRLAHAFVEARLAACVQMLPQMNSVYRWQGKVEQSQECWMLIKTSRDRLSALEAKLHELHSYDVPEFVVLDAATSEPYFKWIMGCVAPDSPK